MDGEATELKGKWSYAKEKLGPMRQQDGSRPAPVESIPRKVQPTSRRAISPREVDLDVVVPNKGE